MQSIHDLLTSGFSLSAETQNQTNAQPTNINTGTGTSEMTEEAKEAAESSSTNPQSKDCDDMNFPKVDWHGVTNLE